MPIETVYTAGGIILGLAIKYFWERWNMDYVTVRKCDANRSLCSKDIEQDIKLIKGVLFEVATHVGVPEDKYKDLIK